MAVFQLGWEGPSQWPGSAAAVRLGSAGSSAAWGVCVRLNQGVEEMEPEGLNEVCRENEKVAGQHSVCVGLTAGAFKVRLLAAPLRGCGGEVIEMGG